MFALVQWLYFTHGYGIVAVYVHRKDSFISDEIVASADELTKDIDV